MRQLATIQRITDIQPIEGADKIEVATVLGWKVVISKADKFMLRDLVVYIEIDSIVPDKPEFAFLKDRKFRVRTIKLRGQVSQGLILPLDVLGKHYDTWHRVVEYKEGDDVTSLIGVKKYDPEGEKEQRILDEKTARESNKMQRFLMQNSWYRRLYRFFSPKKSYSFPSWIKKTDEERIQKLNKLHDTLQCVQLTATEKLDGQSATFFLIKNKSIFSRWFGEKYIFGVCSRNYQLKEDSSNYWKIAKQYNIEKVLRELIEDLPYLILQGEIIGEGIQGNKYKVSGLDFYAFNLISVGNRTPYLIMKSLLNDKGIKSVPLVDRYFTVGSTMEDTITKADGESMIAKGVAREGLVVRNNNDVSFKIISNKFLLKNEE